MADREDQTGDDYSAFTIAEIPGDWPEDVKEALANVFSYDPKTLARQERLGDLAFIEVTPILERVRQILGDLTAESWLDLPPNLYGGALLDRLNQLNQVLAEIQGFDLNQSDPSGAKVALVNRLTEQSDWIKTYVRPFAVKAPARRAAENVARLGDEVEDAVALKGEIASVKREKDVILRDLESHRDLISGLRTVSGESASSELSEVFLERADSLKMAARNWLVALICSGVVAIVGSIAIFLILRPHHAAEASDIGHLTLSVFILGLLVYAVRVCGQQYRANRHSEAVARSKAAALSTFSRFSSAVEEESIRSTLALTLAQAVFATEETGFIDSSGDRVTLIDHALPRVQNWDSIGS